MKPLRLLLLSLSALCACTGGGGAPQDAGSGHFTQYLDTCAMNCALPGSGCVEPRDAGTCIDSCATRAQGLPEDCARCIAEHTGWELHNVPGTSQVSCSLAVGRATSSACARQCQVPLTLANPALVSAQCALACAEPPEQCPAGSASPAACQHACEAAAAGLPRLCAQCLVENVGWVSFSVGTEDGGGRVVSCGSASVPVIGSSCSAFCAGH